MHPQRKLPFFKFDAAAWLLGKIQILSREDKGTFIDILAIIWYENGQVKNDRFLHSKLKVSSTDLEATLSNLEELGIIYQKDGFLRVKFIDTLLDERLEFIEKCSKSGRKSAMKRKVPSTKQKAESISISREQKEEINTTPFIPQGEEKQERFELFGETESSKKPDPYTKWTESKFHDEVYSFTSQYGIEMMDKFFNYWSEEDAKGRMRFQLQKTWNTAKRLVTWKNNNPVNAAQVIRDSVSKQPVDNFNPEKRVNQWTWKPDQELIGNEQ